MHAENPHLSEFLAAVGRQFHYESPDSFWDCEPAFKELARSPAPRELIADQLTRLGASTWSASEGSASEVALHRGGGTALIVTLVEVPLRYLHVFPHHAFYAVLGDKAVEYDRYALPANYRNDLFDPGLKLGPAEHGVLQPGDPLRLPCGQYAFDFKIENPVLLLKFVTTAILPLEWLFKRDTLQAWQANDADLSFTQLRVAADVLGKLAHQSSIKPLKLMSAHGHHAVRWAAITNLGRINRSEAILKLKEAVNDPHPHVRNAAVKTLRKLEP